MSTISAIKFEESKIKKAKFQLAEHPWVSTLVLSLLLIFHVILVAILRAVLGLDGNGLFFLNVLMFFVTFPFIMHLTKGKRSFRDFLEDIRLSRVQPLFPLLALSFSCYLILLLSQATGSIVYRLSQGIPITGYFLRYVFDITVELPPTSWSLVASIPSMFEEVVFRGIVLTLFLKQYSERKSISFSAVAFGLVHLLNLLGSERAVIWVLGQVVWCVIIGLFYGYIVLKSGSLLPAMLMHWLGNAFIYAFTRYIQLNASIATQAVYGVIFGLGLVPTVLMILWVRFFATRWPLASEARP
jgi:membrane protease YdiL (CAAX protease family)